MKTIREIQPFATCEVLQITSRAFANHRFIPTKYTCDGCNVNPPLEIDKIPNQTQCLALVVDEPDVAQASAWWVVWNIPVTQYIQENSIPGQQGINAFNRQAYGSLSLSAGIHLYSFKIYALDEQLNLPTTATKTDLEMAMSRHVLAFGELTGVYQKSMWR